MAGMLMVICNNHKNVGAIDLNIVQNLKRIPTWRGGCRHDCAERMRYSRYHIRRGRIQVTGGHLDPIGRHGAGVLRVATHGHRVQYGKH